ncbi:MAG: SRPBCC domain-containing protein [Anaerolineae bacterium]|nr:SRPBCC domain-containing protein [Anaerolineae bacterium]
MDTAEPVVRRDIWIAAPVERVWGAVTNPEQIMKWWGDIWIIHVLEVGGIIEFGRPGDMIHATIAALDPPRRFSIHWPSQPNYPAENAYTIFDLAEANGGTLLTVTETGYEALSGAERQERMDRTGRGYTTVLANLKAYLEGSTQAVES